MSVQCRLCGTFAADRRPVTTDNGTIDVTVCYTCDRSTCGNCHQHLPGTAMTCPACGHTVNFAPKGSA